MAFNRADFDQALTDIEHYLGYLKGNELAYDYLMRNADYVREQYRGVDGFLFALTTEWGYHFPCPEQRFAVHPGTNWTVTVKVNPGDGFDGDGYVKAVQAQADLAYNEGVAWSAGIAGYLRSICDQFVKPDVAVLRDDILDMHRDVVMPLTDAPNDDWAQLGDLNSRWTGKAAAAFNEFYLNYNDALARSGLFAYLVNLGAAAATKVISATQIGAQDYVQAMRDGLVVQLDQWADVGWKPSDPSSGQFPDWVTDLIAVGDDALTVVSDYVPGMGDVIDVRDDLKHIGGLIGSVADLVGIELPRTAKRVPVQTSDQIYDALTAALSSDYLGGYEQALDRLNSGAGGGGSIEEQAFSGAGLVAQMNADKQDGDWSLPEVSPEPLNDEGDEY